MAWLLLGAASQPGDVPVIAVMSVIAVVAVRRVVFGKALRANRFPRRTRGSAKGR
jgi:hypothetical protein